MSPATHARVLELRAMANDWLTVARTTAQLPRTRALAQSEAHACEQQATALEFSAGLSPCAV